MASGVHHSQPIRTIVSRSGPYLLGLNHFGRGRKSAYNVAQIGLLVFMLSMRSQPRIFYQLAILLPGTRLRSVGKIKKSEKKNEIVAQTVFHVHIFSVFQVKIRIVKI